PQQAQSFKPSPFQCPEITTYSRRVSHIRLDARYPEKCLYIMRLSVEAGGVGFEEFWNVYPRKLNKRRAARAWKKIESSEARIVLASVEDWKKTDQWSRDGGRYIPYPATFLNDRRWDDQFAAAGSQRSHSDGRSKFDDLPLH
ncbi:MAG: hypothetical protein ACRD4Y_13130, partial [Candidatus Acidiferrales bacterium]